MSVQLQFNNGRKKEQEQSNK